MSAEKGDTGTHLRCACCDGESIADSLSSPLKKDALLGLGINLEVSLPVVMALTLAKEGVFLAEMG